MDEFHMPGRQDGLAPGYHHCHGGYSIGTQHSMVIALTIETFDISRAAIRVMARLQAMRAIIFLPQLGYDLKRLHGGSAFRRIMFTIADRTRLIRR